MLARIRKSMEEKDQGFTLIELLVVIIIIGILAAIAIPVFLRQREKGWVSQAQSDLKNAATAAESFATANNGKYETAAATPVDMALTDLETEGFNGTADVVMTVTVAPDANSYCLVANHDQLADNYFYASWLGTPTKGSTCPAFP